MANTFDQFDSGSSDGNPFDQFDSNASQGVANSNQSDALQGASNNSSSLAGSNSGSVPVVSNVHGVGKNQTANQNDSGNHGSPPSSVADKYTGEDFARQLGLTGRYLEGAVPKALASGADMVNSGINYVGGTHLPTNLTGQVDKGLDYMGYPSPQGKVEKGVGEASDVMANLMLGGEGTYNTIKDAGSEALRLGKNGAEAISAPAKTIGAGWNAETPEQLQQSSAALKSGVDDVYKKMRAAGATYNPDSIEELRTNVNKALSDADIIPSLRPQTTDAVDQLNKAADTGDLSLNHLDQYRRLLSGASGEDSAAAGAVRKAIDGHVNQTDASDLLNGSPDAVAYLNRGRAEYTRKANFDDVSDILQKSNGDPTKIKNGLTNFLADADNTRGMTQDEISALRKASQTSSGESMTKMLGKAGFTVIPTNASGNGVLPYVMAAGQLAGKGAVGAAIPGGIPLVAAGTVSKAANTLYGRGKAQQALDLIRNRELPPMPEASEAPPISGLLEKPQINMSPDNTPDQKLLPRGNEDTYYQPQGRYLTYQPGADFVVNPKGTAVSTHGIQTESTGGTVHDPDEWLTLVRQHGKANGITTKDRLTPEKIRQMDKAVQEKKNKKNKYGIQRS